MEKSKKIIILSMMILLGLSLFIHNSTSSKNDNLIDLSEWMVSKNSDTQNLERIYGSGVDLFVDKPNYLTGFFVKKEGKDYEAGARSFLKSNEKVLDIKENNFRTKHAKTQ